MADPVTPNYSFNLPTVGGDDNAWGDLLNANWSSIDAALWSVSGVANAALTQAAGDARYLRLIGGSLGPNSFIVNGPSQFNNYTAFSGAQPTVFNTQAQFTGGATFGTAQVFFNSQVTFSADALMVTPAAADNSQRAATTAWVRTYAGGAYLPLTGGTLTGPLTVAPSSGSGVAAGLIVQGAPGAFASLSLVKPASGLSNQIYGMTGVFGAANTLRWRMELGDTAPESGSNAGSNFAISNLSDAGGVLGTPLSISRNNGWMYLNGNGATPWAAEAAAPGHTAIRMNKASGGVVNALTGSVNGVFRWSMQIGDGGAESGSNAGSNFAINRYSDAGALIDAPLTIARNTGQISSGSTNGDGCINLFGNTQPRLMFYSVAGTLRGQLCYQTSTAQLGIFSPAASVVLNASNQCQAVTYYNASATAYMAGGTLWTNSSDARIKTVLGDYTFGLDHILKLKPVRYRYKANDTIDERLDEPPITDDPDADAKYVMKHFDAAPYPASQHYSVRDQEFVGFVAQDVEDVFPGLVTKRKGFIDGKSVDDLRDLNLNDMLFALVNAVKTLAARVETLEAQLKGAT